MLSLNELTLSSLHARNIEPDINAGVKARSRSQIGVMQSAVRHAKIAIRTHAHAVDARGLSQ